MFRSLLMHNNVRYVCHERSMLPYVIRDHIKDLTMLYDTDYNIATKSPVIITILVQRFVKSKNLSMQS